MFIKPTKSKNFTYAQLVESYRDEEGKNRHRVIFNLGRVEDNPSLLRIGQRLVELASGKKVCSIEDLQGEEVLGWGHVIYKKLWQEYELDRILKYVSEKTKIAYDLPNTVFRMVVQHLLDPCSKLKTYSKQQESVGLEEVELNHLYRALDVLQQHKEEIEKEIFHNSRTLFNMEVDIVYYDVTTFYFESTKNDGELKEFGYSKDGKLNRVQVVMGLFVDTEGRPIGYELFKGNVFDSKTLKKSLETLSERFSIRKVVIVADRGMNSKENLKMIKDKGFGYVFASKLRSMPQQVIEQVLDQEGYIRINEEEGSFKYKVLEYDNKLTKGKGGLEERLIVTYSDKRARKDAADRQRMLDKASKLLAQPSKIDAANKRGGKKYLKQINADNARWVLDKDAIDKSSRLDGYYAIQTSEKKVDPRTILSKHHDLWKIEESFRIMKSNLEVRPMFHWTPRRIKGHFVVCFLAFLVQRELEFRMRKKGIHTSTQEIQRAINSLKVMKFSHGEQSYYMKAKSLPLASKILSLMKITQPDKVTPQEELPL